MSPSAATAATIESAARLIQFGLRPKARPARDEEYRTLIERYRTDDDFTRAAQSVALGLDLVILDVGPAHGVVLGPTEESVFAVRMTEYARRTSSEGRAAERVLHALAHLGAAALAYPRPADLANPAHPGRVTVRGVEAFVREASRRLQEQADANGEDHNPPADAPDLEAAWRVYARRAANPSSADGRKVSSSTTGIVSKALAFLADQGMLTRTSDGDGGTYVTTARYRVQALEAGHRMFAELTDLGVMVISDGTGTLATLEWTAADAAAL